MCQGPPGAPAGGAQVSFMKICRVVLLIIFRFLSIYFSRMDRTLPEYEPEFPAFEAGKVHESQKLPASEVRNFKRLEYNLFGKVMETLQQMHIIIHRKEPRRPP